MLKKGDYSGKTIEKCKEIVEEIYDKFDASHDFAHIERVMKNAEVILATNPANEIVVRLAVCYMILKMLNINQMKTHLQEKYLKLVR